MSLALRNFLFTLVVPGSGAVWIPWWIVTRGGATLEPVAWPALVVIAAGAALYLWCLWLFARVGRGTPGPWDAPRRFVAEGPYRWVRNPIYIAALLVVVGEAWLFLSLALLVYAVPRRRWNPCVRGAVRRADAAQPVRRGARPVPKQSVAV